MFMPWALRLSVLLAFAVSSLAAAQSPELAPELAPAPFKVQHAGTRLVWQNLESGQRQTSIVQAADGMIVRWLWEGRSGASVGHFCTDCVFAGIGADGGALAPLYPLQVGKSVSFTLSKGERSWRDEILVTGTQNISTPAGDFAAYVVRRRSRSLDDHWHAEQRNWYDPGLGWVVKFEGFNSDGGRENWHLVKIE